MFYVNQQLNVIDRKLYTPEVYSHLPPETRLKVHRALLEHIDLIDNFTSENPFRLGNEDQEVIRSWKHFVAGRFYVFRYHRSHAVFLSSTEPAIAYGVVPLLDPFETVIGRQLPRMVENDLLPFKDKIVYDGLITEYSMSFGAGLKRRLNDDYMDAKERQGITTTLPASIKISQPVKLDLTVKDQVKRTRIAKSDPSIQEATRLAHDEIVGLTDSFCREHLDDEYANLCRALADALARKRSSPLIRDKPKSWADAIVRVIGWVNSLGDPSQSHHMTMAEIDKGFGVYETTGSAKATEIRDLLNIRPFDPEWTLPSRMEDNPLAWMIQVNGLIVDARRLPREIQEEAFRKGLIPYIPDNRAGDPAEE